MPNWLASVGLLFSVLSAPGCAHAVTGGGGGQLVIATPAPPVQVLPMTLLEKGARSRLTADQQLVIRDQSTWAAFYRSHNPSGTPPTVDWNTQMVVAVVLARNTGGFAVSINDVSRYASGIVVHYTETTPPAGAIVIQVLTQPYEFITVPTSKASVTFQHLVRVRS